MSPAPGPRAPARGPGRAWIPAALALLLAACAHPVQTRWTQLRALERVAIAPFAADPGPAARTPVTDAEVARVERLVREALHRETALELIDAGVARGADAVLHGTVSRYDPLQGSAAGTFAPAAVCIELALRASDGREPARLWSGTYCEQQTSLLRDLGSLPRAARRGLAWVEADELTAWGATRLARSLARARPRR